MTDAILPLLADSLPVLACRAEVCRVCTMVCQSGGRLWEVSHPRWELLGNIVLGSCDDEEGYPSPETAPAYVDPHINTQPVKGCLVFCGVLEPLFSSTTKRPWQWWAASRVPSSRRVRNIFSIKWLNTPRGFCCSEYRAALDYLLQISGEWDQLATAISLEKRNEVHYYKPFQVVKLFL